MFTIRHSVILTSSHKNIKYSSPDTQSQVNTQQDSLVTANKLVKAIRESSFSKSTELQQLKELIQKAAIENATKKDEIIGLITNEIKKPTRTQAEWDNREYGNPTDGDKKDLQKVLDVWQSEYSNAANKLATATTSVKANTAVNTAAAYTQTKLEVVTMKSQAQAFQKILQATSANPGATALLQAMTTGVAKNNTGDAQTFDHLDLSDTNIPSLLASLMDGTLYESQIFGTNPKDTYSSSGSRLIGDAHAI
jgi:hypothetical protein